MHCRQEASVSLSLPLHWGNQPVIQVYNLTCGFFFYLFKLSNFHLGYFSIKSFYDSIYVLILFSLPCSTRGFQFPWDGQPFFFFFASSYFFHSLFSSPFHPLALFLFYLELCGTHFFLLLLLLIDIIIAHLHMHCSFFSVQIFTVISQLFQMLLIPSRVRVCV